jgi:hypothetical protein
MYYPKSQIKPNLYTNGEEYVIESTNSSYIGYYYLTSTGIAFTGRNPDDLPNQRLLKIEPLLSSKISPNPQDKLVLFSFTDNPNSLNDNFSINYESVLDYAVLKNINIYDPPAKFIPFYSPVLPTQQDYQVGEFRRYFCKKTNQIQYIEINQEQFDQLVAKDPQIEFSLYLPFFIDWQLTGNEQQVARINKNSVELISFQQKLPNVNQYLRFDYTKYYQ